MRREIMLNNFETQIAKDLYWVPIKFLGEATHSVDELKKLVCCSPEEKRMEIRSLADAVNLFRISNFREVSDVIYSTEDDGVVWEHHKPGYDAVLSNEGCCSSCASWLSYMLEGRYETLGMLSYIRSNGNGHCLNYIYHEGWYYFIDMSLKISKYIAFSADETGILSDYLKSRPIANVFLKARYKSAYVDYIVKYQKVRKNVFLFSSCECSYAPPISVTMYKERMHIRYPVTYGIEVLNADQAKQQYTYEFVTPPLKKPCWNGEK